MATCARRFQSTLPVWGATTTFDAWAKQFGISIHAPRVGSDLFPPLFARHLILFQSTLPVWGATGLWHGFCHGLSDFNPRSPCGERRPQPLDLVALEDFNPRSPCGERHLRLAVVTQMYYISIHAPRVGSDPPNTLRIATPIQFQSTLPVWGATCQCHHIQHYHQISIHAPRVGSDIKQYNITIAYVYISIHAPRVGSDSSDAMPFRFLIDFNPRSPCGERLCKASDFEG